MDDLAVMGRALELAAGARTWAHPNPWVGAVLASVDGTLFEGATSPPGGAHAEAAALAAAGPAAQGSTLWCTLEPCCFHGRTPPCTEAIIAAGVRRVVVGLVDPDHRVAGRGLARLRDAGIHVVLGVGGDAVARQLAPYLKHRRTGRPWVVLKLAATLDGRTAAPDGSSQWLTGQEARADAHRLRAESDAVLVGAGTVRADDPSLTVRLVEGPNPLRVVLGTVPAQARVRPCLELGGDLDTVLDDLGGREVTQLLVEGGATVAGAFHRASLVDRYVLYLAPKLFGGDDGRSLFSGPGAAMLADAWDGRIVSVDHLGPDLRVDLVPTAGERREPARQGAAHFDRRPRGDVRPPGRRATASAASRSEACPGGTAMSAAAGGSLPFPASEASL